MDTDGLAEPLDFQQLALNHRLGQFNQGIENLEVPFLHRDLKGLHVQPVTGQYTLRIAPLGISGRKAATRPGPWHAVVLPPARTHFALPHWVLAAGRPRRVLASSMMSSCTSVAVWMISTTAPNLIAPWPE